MPYVYYDELPDGLEAADVVSQEHYDALADELAASNTQRDEALTQIEEARREAREARAKYAQAILDGKNRQEPEHEDEPETKPKGATIADLFA
jgi:hypothetical protein